MIAKQGWFARRKYGGWGFVPKAWQGWVYTAVLILPFIVMAALGISGETQMIVTGIWVIVLIAAMIDIKQSIVLDERERIHEAFAERNALWAIITVLAGGVAYEAARNYTESGLATVDPVILVALAAGLVAKAATNIYLDKKD